jgi:tRNA(Arg) A34 adenosine deaminase TadA
MGGAQKYIHHTELCAMCSGATYWAGVGKVVYDLSKTELYKLTGDHPENLTMRLPCRDVLARGQQATELIGPLLEDEAREVHQEFWE